MIISAILLVISAILAVYLSAVKREMRNIKAELSRTKEKGYEAFPVDMWSSGIALYIMLSGTLPFTLDNLNNNNNIDEMNKNNNNDLQYAIIHNNPNPIENISKEAADLLSGLLDKNPKPWYNKFTKGKENPQHQKGIT